MVDNLEDAIKHLEEETEKQENNAKSYPRPNKNVKGSGRKYNARIKCAKEYKQLAEWLRELQQWKDLGDWLVKAILEEDWDDNPNFYAEVLCRKLTKLGKLKVVDNKYVEVNADEDGD